MFSKLFSKGEGDDDGQAVDADDSGTTPAATDSDDTAAAEPASEAADPDAAAEATPAADDPVPEDEFDENGEIRKKPGGGVGLLKDWRVLAGGGVTVALLLAGGGGWWWMNDDPAAPPMKPLPQFHIEIPARDAAPRPGLLTPPTESTAAATPADAPPAEPPTLPAPPPTTVATTVATTAPVAKKEPVAAATPPAPEPKPAAPAPQPASQPVAAPPPPPRPAVGETRLVNWVLPAAFAAVPTAAHGQALSEAPEPTLVEAGDDGILPKIGADGREPRRAYARTFAATEARPRIAIIITGLGLSRAATEAAITKTPPAMTLAFDPHGKDLASWVSPTRQSGHEMLMLLPMEPHNFPVVDPGPYALWTTVDAPNNVRRLEFVLSRMPGYVGVVSQLGSAFTIQDEAMKPVLEALKKRGLMYVDARSVSQTRGPRLAADLGLGRASVDMVLDAEPARADLDSKLAALEALAREKSVAVATASPYPLTLARLAQWASGLEAKRLVLAPISAVADKQPVP